MKKISITEQIGIINLCALKDIVVSDGKLTAPLDPSYAQRVRNFKPPVKRIVIIDHDQIVGHGEVTRAWDLNCDHRGESVVVFTIAIFKAFPQFLSNVQLAALRAYLKEYGVKKSELTGVMPLALEMDSLFPEPDSREPILLGMNSESWLRAERQCIHDDESLCEDQKLRLLQALDVCGQHADDVWSLHTELCGEGAQDFEPHPILPWESITKEERLDPHNWVLLPSVLASNFRIGLITFSDDGNSMLSQALLTDLHQFDIYYDFTLYTLTERQREYMKVHREEIFDSWRANPPWLYDFSND